MGSKKIRKKPGRKAGKSNKDLAAPIDSTIFQDAFKEIVLTATKPFVVTPEHERPSFSIPEIGELYTVNTDHPMYRTSIAALKFCERRELDRDTHWLPIVARLSALVRLVRDLKDEPAFGQYVKEDIEDDALCIRNDVIAMAAKFPLRPDVPAFDPKAFLAALSK